MVKKIYPNRRQFLSSSVALGLGSGLAKPALALTEDFLLQRGDLRIGLMAGYPPYSMVLAGARFSGVLPSIALHFSHEMWLTPSYSIIPREDIGLFSYSELFKRNGGLDIIIHAPTDLAKQQGMLCTQPYITDSLSYFGVPDIREISIFPHNFGGRKLLAYPEILINRLIIASSLSEAVEIDFDVSDDDLYSGLVFEKIINNQYDVFMSSRRQIEWIMDQSRHKFHLNDVFLINARTQFEFCVMVNPRSAWMLPRLDAVIDRLRNDGNLGNIFTQYNLVVTSI